MDMMMDDEDRSQRRFFAALGALAALALVVAGAAWLLALPSAGVWIVACLVVLVAVVGVEIYLLTTMRRSDPWMQREAPNPHRGPGADDEVIDFIVEPDDADTDVPPASR